MEKLWLLWKKHREGLLYLVFGGLTTVVNYLVYAAACFLLPEQGTTLPNLIAWVLSVAFAYVTNRIWVFQSRAHGLAEGLREISAFVGARVFTLVLETLVLWVLVDWMGLPNLPIKLAANVLVIVLNYVLSKFWIFKPKACSSGSKS